MKAYILYHASCSDGFGAAWAAWQALGDNAEYIPVLYNQPPPELPEDADVLIIDFSYPREVLLALKEHVSSRIKVLDHHQTAEADLAGLDFCTFDMHHSGAMLAWKHWFPRERSPALIKYVQDRDLWKWELPFSREVSAWLESYPRDFELWSQLAQRLDTKGQLQQIVSEGEAILRFKDQQVTNMCKQAVFLEVGGYQVPVANATVFFSEVGDLLCQMYPEMPFAAYFFDRSDGKRQWGLRSRNGFDVSAVAKQYGGGGHAAAAGFTLDAPEVL